MRVPLFGPRDVLDAARALTHVVQALGSALTQAQAAMPASRSWSAAATGSSSGPTPPHRASSPCCKRRFRLVSWSTDSTPR